MTGDEFVDDLKIAGQFLPVGGRIPIKIYTKFSARCLFFNLTLAQFFERYPHAFTKRLADFTLPPPYAPGQIVSSGKKNLIKGNPFGIKGILSVSKGILFTAKGIPSASKGIPSAPKGFPFTSKGILSASKGILFTAKGIPSASTGFPFIARGNPCASKRNVSAYHIFHTRRLYNGN
jgi:hypothetical protein